MKSQITDFVDDNRENGGLALGVLTSPKQSSQMRSPIVSRPAPVGFQAVISLFRATDMPSTLDL